MAGVVILQPAGNKGAREHYLDTIANPVKFENYQSFIDSNLYRQLLESHPSGDAPVWGVVPGKSSRNSKEGVNQLLGNVTKWNRISQGDLVLFAADKRITSYGLVALKFNSKKFAEKLWGLSEENQAWEYMYTLTDLKQIDMSYEEFNEVVGYKSNNIIQGFTVMDEDKSGIFLDYLGKIDISVKKSIPKLKLVRDSFGEITGYPEGSTFELREDLRKAGLHSKPMDGISCIFGNPADAIVLSGGYKADIDEGDYILYTGQGGRDPKTEKQIEDQVLEKGNLGLVMSKDRGIPIRVIRGSGHKSIYSPKEGYRYDGLYSIDEAFTEQSSDGPWIWRFELRKIKSEEIQPWTQQEPASTANKALFDLVAPAGNTSPERRSSGVIQRIVRNSKVTQFIKALYDNRCQFCEIQLMTSSGGYSEGAHIRPLGGIHKGSDTTENILCLCANCHTLFDKGALYVEETSLKVKSTIYPEYEVSLVLLNKHLIDISNLEYHRLHIAGFHVKEPTD
jgi:putative restriction endonuclease